MEQNYEKDGNVSDRNEQSISAPIDKIETPERNRNDCNLPVLTTKRINDSKASEKFRQSLKYNDRESYVSQRDHKLGIGLFNTDEIEDLPPRHKKKVLKIYEELKAYEMELVKREEALASTVPHPPEFFERTYPNKTCFSSKEDIPPNPNESSKNGKNAIKNNYKTGQKNKYQCGNGRLSDFHSSSSKSDTLLDSLGSDESQKINPYSSSISCNDNRIYKSKTDGVHEGEAEWYSSNNKELLQTFESSPSKSKSRKSNKNFDSYRKDSYEKYQSPNKSSAIDNSSESLNKSNAIDNSRESLHKKESFNRTKHVNNGSTLTFENSSNGSPFKQVYSNEKGNTPNRRKFDQKLKNMSVDSEGNRFPSRNRNESGSSNTSMSTLSSENMPRDNKKVLKIYEDLEAYQTELVKRSQPFALTIPHPPGFFGRTNQNKTCFSSKKDIPPNTNGSFKNGESTINNSSTEQKYKYRLSDCLPSSQKSDTLVENLGSDESQKRKPYSSSISCNRNNRIYKNKTDGVHEDEAERYSSNNKEELLKTFESSPSRSKSRKSNKNFDSYRKESYKQYESLNSSSESLHRKEPFNRTKHVNNGPSLTFENSSNESSFKQVYSNDKGNAHNHRKFNQKFSNLNEDSGGYRFPSRNRNESCSSNTSMSALSSENLPIGSNKKNGACTSKNYNDKTPNSNEISGTRTGFSSQKRNQSHSSNASVSGDNIRMYSNEKNNSAPNVKLNQNCPSSGEKFSSSEEFQSHNRNKNHSSNTSSSATSSKSYSKKCDSEQQSVFNHSLNEDSNEKKGFLSQKRNESHSSNASSLTSDKKLNSRCDIEPKSGTNFNSNKKSNARRNFESHIKNFNQSSDTSASAVNNKKFNNRYDNEQQSVSSLDSNENYDARIGFRSHNRNKSNSSDTSTFVVSNKHFSNGCDTEQQSAPNHSFNKNYEAKPGLLSHKRNKNNSSITSTSAANNKSFRNRYDHEQFSVPERVSQKDQNVCSQSVNQRTNSNKRSLNILSLESSQYSDSIERDKAEEDKKIDTKSIPKVKDLGFFLHVTVSEHCNKLEMWKFIFEKHLKSETFDVMKCCDYAESIILCFKSVEDATRARYKLYKFKHTVKDISKPHVISFSSVKKHLVRPCLCEDEFMKHCDEFFEEFTDKYIATHKAKIDIIIDELNSLKRSKASKEQRSNLEDALNTLKAMEVVFLNYYKKAKEEAKNSAMSDLKKLKLNFSRECNAFERSLPIYSQKDVILNAVKHYPVSVIVAETGSGKSTQLTQYLLQTSFAENGSIICTQPRKIAAISITKFVSTQIGSLVGKEVGYDVGIEKKFEGSTKIIYMTDYALLRKCLRNKNLKGVSCVIIDEAHERTLYTDLLLGLLKQCLSCRPDLRIIITSATINPSVFVQYFNLPDGAVINVPGRAYPVKVVWSEHDVGEGYQHVSECVKTAVRVHRKEPKGDILVFLSSPAEIDEAILLFQEMCSTDNMPELMSLHGKSDIKDQMLVFETNTNGKRRIIFATNAAETSLTIPGIRYVIDSGMAKELIFYPEKNKSCLMPTLINKSSAEQRKGRAGRTQPGVCYRLYSKKDYEGMLERALPELLKTDLLNALLKVYEFGIKPSSFDFVESPSKEAITRSVESLEVLELVENNELTKLGQQVVHLSIEPRLAKFILLSVDAGMGHEAAIIAALVSEAGRIFLRFDDNKEFADQMKRKFCQRNGDLCTFLEIYKRWLEVPQAERFNWCVSNYISSKALHSARKTVNEILITLRKELSLTVSRRYNYLSFKQNFETMLFRSFVENLCIYSGHPSLGYQSPNFKESLFIHPSSSLKYLRVDPPKFLVYTVFMETTRNYILDVTPLKEEVVNKAYFKGYNPLSVAVMKQLQIPPITVGPFGEKILYRYILGKGGSVISNIEHLLGKLTKNKNFRIDICRNKGLVIIHVEEKFHEKVSKFIDDIVNDAREEMAKETDVVKMEEGFFYYCLTSGGLVQDIIMPGEFREITIEPIYNRDIGDVENTVKKFGPIQNIEKHHLIQNKQSINVTYFTVADAQNAVKCLKEKNVKGIRVKNIVPVGNKSSKPLYRLKFTWPRLLSKGTGSILFSSEENCVLVSGKLSTTPLFIDKNHISVTPSPDGRSLNLKYLPQSANKESLLNTLSEALPYFLRDLIKGIEINRFATLPVVESEIMKIKDELLQNLCRFTPPCKVVVDVVQPTTFSENYKAFAYFECAEDGKTAHQQLNGKLKLNSIPITIQEVLQSRIKCKKYIYNFLQKAIQRIMEQHQGKLLKISAPNEDEVIITFSSTSIEELDILIKELLKLVHGRKVDCCYEKKYFHLFTQSGKRILDKIETRTNTLIECNTEKKVLLIYGKSDKCVMAEAEIHSYINSAKLLNTKIYDLKSSEIPPGFLKELFSMYGWDLYGLIRKFDLKEANIDMKFGKLTVEGEAAKLPKVDEHLEEICTKLYAIKPKKVDDDIGFGLCAICLDPIQFDYYRLENCGHSFCKSCLVLQLGSKIIPVTCVQENCGKPFFLIDINRILSLGGNELRHEFQNAALQHHVRTHSDQISYCPTPDCNTIYRVSGKSAVDVHCPSCSNDICAYCRTYSHKGMSCDILQNSKVDADYSLKVWMQENNSCKQCPKCKVCIEKIEGCNHMVCANCNSHLCWLCLEIFKSGDLVYDHLPYCPKNQTA